MFDYCISGTRRPFRKQNYSKNFRKCGRLPLYRNLLACTSGWPWEPKTSGKRATIPQTTQTCNTTKTCAVKHMPRMNANDTKIHLYTCILLWFQYLVSFSVPTHHVAILHRKTTLGTDPMARGPPKMAFPKRCLPRRQSSSVVNRKQSRSPGLHEIQVKKMELVYLLAGALGKHSRSNVWQWELCHQTDLRIMWHTHARMHVH